MCIPDWAVDLTIIGVWLLLVALIVWAILKMIHETA